jgi:Phosphonate metabolism protein PhnJ
MSVTVRQLLDGPRGAAAGILDEGAKREIGRATLTAVCVPGYQVPFGSPEMPVVRGWESGGLQVTLGVIGPGDVLKVIDQGDDGGVNATNLRRIVSSTAGCATATDTRAATVIQTRHRVPEEALGGRQVLVYQVPVADPLRGVQKSSAECDRMHAGADYSAMWVSLYEDLVRNGVITMAALGWRPDPVRASVKASSRTEAASSAPPPLPVSPGERQRINLAAGTVRPPRLLLLDEPVSALDPANRELALSLIASLTSQGVAVLAVFHDLDAIRRLATRVLRMEGGQVVAAGPASEILGELEAVP